jgi:hypothetical protein
LIFTTRIISVVGGLFFLTVMISSFANAVFTFGSAWKMIVALAATRCLVLLIVHWVSLRMSQKMFLIVFVSLGFVVRMAWILWNPALPASDFLFNAALKAASGDFPLAIPPIIPAFLTNSALRCTSP